MSSDFFHCYSEMALVVSLFQEVTEKNSKTNKPLLNESQEMVLAQLPETLNAHTQSDMQVICTGAKRKVSHFQNGTTGKLRVGGGGNQVLWDERGQRTKEVQLWCSSVQMWVPECEMKETKSRNRGRTRVFRLLPSRSGERWHTATRVCYVSARACMDLIPRRLMETKISVFVGHFFLVQPGRGENCHLLISYSAFYSYIY